MKWLLYHEVTPGGWTWHQWCVYALFIRAHDDPFPNSGSLWVIYGMGVEGGQAMRKPQCPERWAKRPNIRAKKRPNHVICQIMDSSVYQSQRSSMRWWYGGKSNLQIKMMGNDTAQNRAEGWRGEGPLSLASVIFFVLFCHHLLLWRYLGRKEKGKRWRVRNKVTPLEQIVLICKELSFEQKHTVLFRMGIFESLFGEIGACHKMAFLNVIISNLQCMHL